MISRLLIKLIATVISSSLVISTHAHSQSADVILGELLAPQIHVENNDVFMGAATTSCNAGDQALNWYSAPDNRHPVIALNLYRHKDGRLEQLGQSWLKHGIFALEHNLCGFGCKPTHGGNQLGPGCSDPYGAAMNSGPNLGSRSEVNPVTGFFNGSTSNDHSGHTHTFRLEHSLRADKDDVIDEDSEFFIEGHYITSDDAIAGNGHNNVSYRKIKLEKDFRGNDYFEENGLTVRNSPTITAWPESNYKIIDSTEEEIGEKRLTGRIIVAIKIGEVKDGVFRYDYAIYNMNSNRGVQSFSVPVGNAKINGIGSSAPKSFGESWSNEPWVSTIEDGMITWWTAPYSQDENSNAIRWGTMYNFWFETSSSPSSGEVVMNKFKPGVGPNSVKTVISVPEDTAPVRLIP